MAEMQLTVKTKVTNSSCTVGLGVDEGQWANMATEVRNVLIADDVLKLITVTVEP